MYELYIRNTKNEYVKINTFIKKEKAIELLNYFRKTGLGGYIEKIYK